MSKIEILFISGLALVATGIACIYWPAALIFSGLAMAVIAFKLASAPPVPAPTPTVGPPKKTEGN